MKISDIKILYKILACFGLLVAVVAGAVWFATSRMSTIDQTYSTIIEKDAMGALSMVRANRAFTAFRLAAWQIVAETKMEDMKKAATQKGENEKRLFDFLNDAKGQLPRSQTQVAEIKQQIEAVLPTYKQAETLGLANKNEEATAVLESVAPKMSELAQKFTAINDDIIKSMNNASAEATDTVNRTIMITYAAVGGATVVVAFLARDLIASTEFYIMAFAAAALIFGAVLSLVIGRAISKPIIALVPDLKKMAEGDFNVTLSGRGRKDEVGQIADAAEMIADRVGSTIGNIRISAKEVTNASAEISTSTTDLSQRTEEQAASLEETSASMEEMTATVKKNAENAQQASSLAGTRGFHCGVEGKQVGLAGDFIDDADDVGDLA